MLSSLYYKVAECVICTYLTIT